jgi:trans-aconitate methyltransferase
MVSMFEARRVKARAVPVDMIFSTATIHCVRDHDALVANLAAFLRPAGSLVAQCGGVSNIERGHAAAR